MGNLCKQCDKECIKKTMLKQEETFRNQIRELHQLHKVQKKLMKDFKADLRGNLVSSGLQIKIEKSNAETTQHEHYNSRLEEESNLELTLAIGNLRKNKLLSPQTSEQVSSCLQLSLCVSSV